jgi:hypothetical protein
LRLRFCLKDSWKEAVVHHFSASLFSRQRRFLADLHDSDHAEAGRRALQILPVQQVVQVGQMIRIELMSASRLFANADVLCLRPALLNRSERYIFYSDHIANRREDT